MRTRADRGFALADFLAGTLILTGAVIAFASMTITKVETIGEAGMRLRAVQEATSAIERFRVRGGFDEAAAALSRDASADGWHRVGPLDTKRSAAPKAGVFDGEIEARPAAGVPPTRLLEVRAVVRWQTGPSATSSLSVATALGKRGG